MARGDTLACWGRQVPCTRASLPSARRRRRRPAGRQASATRRHGGTRSCRFVAACGPLEASWRGPGQWAGARCTNRLGGQAGAASAGPRGWTWHSRVSGCAAGAAGAPLGHSKSQAIRGVDVPPCLQGGSDAPALRPLPEEEDRLPPSFRPCQMQSELTWQWQFRWKQFRWKPAGRVPSELLASNSGLHRPAHAPATTPTPQRRLQAPCAASDRAEKTSGNVVAR